MKAKFTLAAAVVLACAGAIGLLHRRAPAAGGADLKTKKAKISYALGYTVGKSIRDQEVEVDADVFVRAVRDGLTGGKSTMSEADMTATMKAFRREMMMLQKERAERLAAENLVRGKAYRDAHAKEAGVQVAASGLQYKVLRAGTGKQAAAGGIVTIHYTGRLIDGTEFASTYRSGKAVIRALGQGVIPGWAEGIPLMKEGAKFQFVLPPELAYGKRGSSAVPPGATVIYEIELIKVQ